MNKKGFTLAELLGVIVIISIILLLVMIPITKNLQEGTNTIHDAQIKIIELGTENWISDNKDSLPQKEGDKVTITVGTLKQEGFLEMDVKDPTTGECIPNNTEVTITKTENGYEIYVDEDSGTDECPDIDGSAPIIYLNGEALMYVEYGSTWIDPGATAKTSKGVPINEIKTEISGSGTTINTNGFNTYEITYSATDNGITVSTKRTVIIHDTTPPVITVPENTVIPSTQTSFNALDGVTATDNADGNITDKIKVTGSVTPGILGEYVLTYEVEDSSGNKTSVTRKVTILDKNPPSVTATVQGNPFNSNGWAKNNFQIKVKVTDTGGSGAAGFKYCYTTSTTCTPSTNVSKVVENLTISTQSATNYVCIIPYDHAGNEGTRQCFGPYKLDKTNPTTNVTAAASQFNSAGWAKSNISVSLTTSDTGSSNVKSYTYCTSTTSTCTPTTTENGTSKTITLSTNVTTHYVCAYSTDYADNKSTTVCTGPHKLDKNKPTITLSVASSQFNSNGWAKANISVGLTTADTGGSNVKSYTYCTSSTGTCTPTNKVNATSGTLTISAESATNYVCAYSTDNADNNSDTKCVGPYKLDKTKPTISFTDNITVNQSVGSSYNVKSGVTVGDNLTATASLNFTATSNLNFATPGRYTVTFNVTDLAGNTTTKTRTVTIVDNVAPELTVTTSCAKTGKNGWCQGNVTATLTVGSDPSGISSYEYKVGNGSWTTLSGKTHTNSSEGSYTISYRVKDGSGNYSATKTITVNKDSVAPACSVALSGTFGNNSWYRSNVTGTLSYSDGTSQVRYYNTAASSISSSTNTTASYVYTSDTASQKIYGYVEDNAGNVTRCESSTFKKDTTPPYTVLVQLYDGGNVTEKITYTCTNTTNAYLTTPQSCDVDNDCLCANGACGHWYINTAYDNISGVAEIVREAGVENGRLAGTECKGTMTRTDRIYSIDGAGNVGPVVTISGYWHY